jgi:hypothetical protein
MDFTERKRHSVEEIKRSIWDEYFGVEATLGPRERYEVRLNMVERFWIPEDERAIYYAQARIEGYKQVAAELRRRIRKR